MCSQIGPPRRLMASRGPFLSVDARKPRRFRRGFRYVWSMRAKQATLYLAAPAGQPHGEAQRPHDPWAQTCPRCGAAPQEGRVSPSGMRTGDHKARERAAGLRGSL